MDMAMIFAAHHQSRHRCTASLPSPPASAKTMVFPDFPSENMAFFTVLNPEMVVSSGFFGVETDRCCSQWMAKANTKKNKPSKMGMQSAKTRWSIENYRSLIAWIWNCHLWVFQFHWALKSGFLWGLETWGHRKFFPLAEIPYGKSSSTYHFGILDWEYSASESLLGWGNQGEQEVPVHGKESRTRKKITSTYRMHPMFDSKKIKSNSKKRGF